MKSIKVSEQVWTDLRDRQRPRESLTDVIGRLVDVSNQVQSLVDKMGVNHGRTD